MIQRGDRGGAQEQLPKAALAWPVEWSKLLLIRHRIYLAIMKLAQSRDTEMTLTW